MPPAETEGRRLFPLVVRVYDASNAVIPESKPHTHLYSSHTHSLSLVSSESTFPPPQMRESGARWSVAGASRSRPFFCAFLRLCWALPCVCTCTFCPCFSVLLLPGGSSGRFLLRAVGPADLSLVRLVNASRAPVSLPVVLRAVWRRPARCLCSHSRDVCSAQRTGGRFRPRGDVSPPCLQVFGF